MRLGFIWPRCEAGSNSKQMNIAVYISGHGFGHLAQVAPVLNKIYQCSPECRFLIRSPLPESELKARLQFDFQLEPEAVDIGVIQKSAIEEDREESIAAMRTWTDAMGRHISREVALLKRFAPSLVLSNISPLAFPAAKAVGAPAIGLASLDWHTIYSHWLPESDSIIATLKKAYRQCDFLLTPPMAMDMGVFTKKRTIPLIAAHPKSVGINLRQGYKKRALVIFGGSGSPAYDMDALAAMSEWLFLIPEAPDHAPRNVQSIHFGPALRAVDLMPQVDAVVCKPGYGILAESWRTDTPVAWVERPDFPEYPILKKWLDELFPSCGMDRKSFHCGNWLPALEGAVASSRPFPQLEQDGADIAAEITLSVLDGKTA